MRETFVHRPWLKLKKLLQFTFSLREWERKLDVW
jgi:hypothetical protein